jgi:integrase
MAVGTIRKRERANGPSYEARIDHPWRKAPSGAPKTLTKSFKKRADAVAWLDARRAEFRSGADSPGDRPVMTLIQACEAWLELVAREGQDNRGAVSASTLMGYRQIVANQIAARLADTVDIGPMPIASITAGTVRDWARGVEASFSRGMAKRALRIVKAALDLAIVNEALAINPARAVKVAAERKRREDDGSIEIILQREDVARIRQAAAPDASDPVSFRQAALVDTLIGTGARIGEALALQWRSVDLEGAVISISQTVTKADGSDDETGRIGSKIGPPKSAAGRRQIAIPARLVRVLSEWRDIQLGIAKRGGELVRLKAAGLSNVEIGRRLGITEAAVRKRLSKGPEAVEVEAGDRFVFGTRSGETWQLPSNFWSDTWRPLMAASGLVDEAGQAIAGPHDLRHHFASVAIGAGVALEDLTYILGHESIDVTLRHYHHLLGDKLERSRRVAAAVAAAMDETPSSYRENLR